jgi:hypothetical protein
MLIRNWNYLFQTAPVVRDRTSFVVGRCRTTEPQCHPAGSETPAWAAAR